ncbi:MAG: ABC transporter permease [Nocardioidaceae bacterium]|nr:ABC transporter permease [Nocardioidaceae bacterium]
MIRTSDSVPRATDAKNEAENPDSTTLPGAVAGRHRSAGDRVVDLLRSGSLAVPVGLVGLAVLFSALRPDTFGTSANFQSLLTTQAVLVILAFGLTVLSAAGEFDLSAAAVLGLSAGVVASLTTKHDMNVLLAVLIAVGLAAAVGLVNAMFVVGFGVDSLVTTLGMGTVVTGIALGTVGPTTIGGLPESVTKFGQTQIGGIGIPFFYALGLLAVGWFLLQRTATGRHIYFVGEAQTAARLVGLKVDKIRVGAFLTASVGAGVAGVILVAQTGAASTSYGGPYLLPAYAATFLGATVHRGRFGVVGTFLAVYLLTVGTQGLQMLGSPDWVTQVFSGGVLVIAVTVAKLSRRSGGR